MNLDALWRRIEQLEARIAELESENVQHWQFRKNLFRNAKVKSYDGKSHRAIVVDKVEGDEGEIETTNIKVMSQAGAVKKRTTLSESEHVLMISPNGQVDETSFVLPFGPNKTNTTASEHGEEDITICGQTSVKQRKDLVEVKAGPALFEVTPSKIFGKLGGNQFLITESEILLKGKIRTDGLTRLDNGTRPAHPKGGEDSAGDIAVTGASGVLI